MLKWRFWLALALLATAPAAAQDQTMEVMRLADGVYGMIRSEARFDPVESNAVAVIGDDYVLVFDANRTPTAAAETIAAIRRLTGKPVRYVVNSHNHDDHVLGNQAYQAAFPGVEFIAHDNTRADMLTETAGHIPEALQAYERGIPRVEAALRTGRRSNGEALSEADRRQYAHLLPVYRTFLERIRPIRLVPQTLTFDSALTLHQGAREIQLRYLGDGNTRGDVVLWLPRERILLTGDLLVHPVPFAFGSFIADWARTMTALRRFNAAIIVPGHGPVMRDHAFLDDVTALLAELARQVEAGVARGLSLEQVRQSMRLDAFRDRMAGTDPQRLGTWQASIMTGAVNSAYEQAVARRAGSPAAATP